MVRIRLPALLRRKRRVEAAVMTGMAGRSHLNDLRQHGVAVAVNRERLDILHMPAGFSLHPERLPAPREIGHPPRIKRPAETLLVHPRHHQDFVRARVLHDARNQSAVIFRKFAPWNRAGQNVHPDSLVPESKLLSDQILPRPADRASRDAGDRAGAEKIRNRFLRSSAVDDQMKICLSFK